jgi:site-specific DNA recombinase
MDKTIRIALYTRVSTSEQAAEGTSLEYQKEQLEVYCKAQGWEVFSTYTDPGCSGKDDKRPGLKRLMQDAKAGLFDKVIVLKLDRLSRNLRLLLELQEKLQENDVALISLKENIDTTMAIGKTVFQVLGLVGEWERSAIIERTRSGRIQRYKEGCWA